MTDNLPLVSVIIPAYNAEAFIATAVSSATSQTYPTLEILVIDDGSEDGTADIVRTLAVDDDRIVYLRQPNAGVAATRNLGIEKAKGEFIAPLDADDVWHADKIAKQMRCMMRAGNNVGLVYSWSLDIDDQNEPIGDVCVSNIDGQVYPTLLCHNFVGNGSAPLIRRVCLDQIGGYNGDLKTQDAQGCEDWDLNLRIAEHFEFSVVAEFHVGYRKTFATMSGDYHQMARSHAAVLRLARDRNPNLPVVLTRISSSALYVYFARQCHLHGKHAEARHWLRESVSSGWAFPFLHHVFYRLLIQTVLRLGRHSVDPKQDVIPVIPENSPSPNAAVSAAFDAFQGHDIRVRVNLFLVTIFHKTISFIYRMYGRHRLAGASTPARD